jgi:hypothetical protein
MTRQVRWGDECPDDDHCDFVEVQAFRRDGAGWRTIDYSQFDEDGVAAHNFHGPLPVPMRARAHRGDELSEWSVTYTVDAAAPVDPGPVPEPGVTVALVAGCLALWIIGRLVPGEAR